MGLSFEWDPDKAKRNLSKHAVSFEEAATVFGDPLSLTIEDPLYSGEEECFVTIGRSIQGHTLIVVHTERQDRICVISARVATARERSAYEQGTGADT